MATIFQLELRFAFLDVTEQTSHDHNVRFFGPNGFEQIKKGSYSRLSAVVNGPQTLRRVIGLPFWTEW